MALTLAEFLRLSPLDPDGVFRKEFHGEYAKQNIRVSWGKAINYLIKTHNFPQRHEKTFLSLRNTFSSGEGDVLYYKALLFYFSDPATGDRQNRLAAVMLKKFFPDSGIIIPVQSLQTLAPEIDDRPEAQMPEQTENSGRSPISERAAVGLEPSAPFKWPDHVSEEDVRRKDAPEGIWLNPHNHYSIPLSGRDEEWSLLDNFINHDRHFLIGALIAPSGAGKTRLISEWMKQYMAKYNDNGWDAGFVDNRDARYWSEKSRADHEQWNPTKNTLIIIDYTYNYDDVIGTIFHRFNAHTYGKKIRLLILDHVLPTHFHSDIAWRKVSPDSGSLDSKGRAFFRPLPIVLKPETDNSILLRDVIACTADPQSDKGYNRDSPVVVRAAEALMEIGNLSNADLTEDQVRTRDSIRHPLFAALIGQAIGENRDLQFTGWSRRDLITRYFERGQRIPWQFDHRNKYAETLGPWVGCYVCTATLLRGAPVWDMERCLPDEVRTALSADDRLSDLADYANRIVSGENPIHIPAFEPDILGESFFLKFIIRYRSHEVVLNVLSAMLSERGQRSDEYVIAKSFTESLYRLTRNLLNDNYITSDVKLSWISLSVFLSPQRFMKETQLRFSVSIILSEIASELHNVGGRELADYFISQIELSDLMEAMTGPLEVAAIASVMRIFDLALQNKSTGEELSTCFYKICRLYESGCTDESTPLMFACSNGFFHVVNYLIMEGADVRQSNEDGMTSLHFACSARHYLIAEHLINCGANPGQRTWMTKYTPLMLLFTPEMDGELLLRVFDAAQSPEQVAREQLSHALVTAATEGDSQLTRDLLVNGAYPDYDDEHGFFPLLRAAQSGNVETLSILIDHGASIRKTTEHGESALYCAVNQGNVAAAMYLFDRGGYLKRYKKAVDHTLHMAVLLEQVDIVEEILVRGVAPDLTDERNDPLCSAALNGNSEIIALLCKYGADPDGRRGPEYIPLTYAAWNGNVEAVLTLLDCGASLNHRSEFGRSALLEAVEYGHEIVVHELLVRGAEVNMIHLMYGNAFGPVQTNRDGMLVNELRWHDRENPKTAGERYASALNIAQDMGFVKIEKMLRKFNARTAEEMMVDSDFPS